MGKIKSTIPGDGVVSGRLTEARVRELAGHVFTEEEIAAAVASTRLTEREIILAARWKARRWKAEDEKRRPTPPEPERQRVIAGYRWLKGEIAKAAAHMDVTALLDDKPKAPPFRTMTPHQAEERLARLAELYARTPLRERASES